MAKSILSWDWGGGREWRVGGREWEWVVCVSGSSEILLRFIQKGPPYKAVL